MVGGGGENEGVCAGNDVDLMSGGCGKKEDVNVCNFIDVDNDVASGDDPNNSQLHSEGRDALSESVLPLYKKQRFNSPSAFDLNVLAYLFVVL